mmetsp:Transcript_17491/g.32560  ORF Transcript_17491/g.32560 Transcript_17491/m.32560 type:complete len:207 (-) Transcript_17491:104-724(-)
MRRSLEKDDYPQAKRQIHRCFHFCQTMSRPWNVLANSFVSQGYFQAPCAPTCIKPANLPFSFFHVLFGGTASTVSQCSTILPPARRYRSKNDVSMPSRVPSTTTRTKFPSASTWWTVLYCITLSPESDTARSISLRGSIPSVSAGLWLTKLLTSMYCSISCTCPPTYTLLTKDRTSALFVSVRFKSQASVGPSTIEWPEAFGPILG